MIKELERPLRCEASSFSSTYFVSLFFRMPSKHLWDLSIELMKQKWFVCNLSFGSTSTNIWIDTCQLAHLLYVVPKLSWCGESPENLQRNIPLASYGRKTYLGEGIKVCEPVKQTVLTFNTWVLCFYGLYGCAFFPRNSLKLFLSNHTILVRIHARSFEIK